MANIIGSLSNIRLLDELATGSSMIHRVHPLMKLLSTGVFLVVTVSFGKYQLGQMLPLILYPIIMMGLADVPAKPLLKRMVLVSPFIIGIGIFNPFYDHTPFTELLGIPISGGWISFASILLKGMLTILSALILVATTGMNQIGSAVKMLGVPRIMIMQLLLTYRYITVFIEEVGRTMSAYSLRSAERKTGIRYAHWGSLTGQLLMRTLDRAQRIYQAMCCRGYEGEYRVGEKAKIKGKDIGYLAGWCIFFVLVRLYDIPNLLGSLAIGATR